MWWLSEFPPDPGGIGRLAQQVGPHLVQRGVDLHHLVTWHGPSEESCDDVPITRIPARDAVLENRPADLLAVRRSIAETKRRVAPDVYHLHVCEPSPVLHVGTQSAHPSPSVVTLHNEVLGTIGGGGEGTLLGRLFDEATIITTVSAASADDLLRGRPDLATKVVIVENGVAIGAPPAPPVPAPVLAVVGRLVAQKGIDRLLRAVALVAPRVPDVRLVVAGDGPERGPLEALCRDLGLSDRVEFLGHVAADDVRRVLEGCRVAVSSSHWEGLPFALLEAGERGRAMVATDVGGNGAVVRHEQTGLLVDEAGLDADPGPLAAAIERVLVEPGLAERMGDAARSLVEGRFGIAACADSYAAIYRRVGATTPAPRVSVLVPARNAARFIGDALRSVQEQTFTDWELVVVDDGSTDDTAAIAARLGGDRCTVVRQPGRGSGTARNAALAMARGDVIAHLDADDVWPSDRLERLVAALDADPSLDAVFGVAVEFADADAPPTARVIAEPTAVRLGTTGVVRRSAHDRIGPFRAVAVADQLEWTGRLLAMGAPVAEIDALVLRRRVHGTNNSHQHPSSTTLERVHMVRDLLALKRRQASRPEDGPGS